MAEAGYDKLGVTFLSPSNAFASIRDSSGNYIVGKLFRWTINDLAYLEYRCGASGIRAEAPSGVLNHSRVSGQFRRGFLQRFVAVKPTQCLIDRLTRKMLIYLPKFRWKTSSFVPVNDLECSLESLDILCFQNRIETSFGAFRDLSRENRENLSRLTE